MAVGIIGTVLTAISTSPQEMVRRKLDPISRMPGDFMTCTVMCGNSVWTGMVIWCMVLIQEVLPRGRAGWCVEAAGMTMRTAAPRTFETERRGLTTATDSDLSETCQNNELNAIAGGSAR